MNKSNDYLSLREAEFFSYKKDMKSYEYVSKEKPILLLKGGVSSEREVSLESGKCVENALTSLGYKVIPFDTLDGIETLVKIIMQEKPCCIFNALHGGWGENGSFQGLLNMLKIPYTHSGVLASSIAMNKHETKRYASILSIDTAKGFLIPLSELKKKKKVDFSCVIKPNQEGSSVGVFILKDNDLIPDEIQSLKGDNPVLVEEYIPGREFSVAVMDDGPLGIIEIIPKTGFYDYEHKYQEGMTEHVEPKNLSEIVKEKMMKQAYQMHNILGCKGVSRSDFRYDEKTNRVVFLELNANPGMTKLSLVPEMALQKNITYNELVDILVKKADFEK